VQKIIPLTDAEKQAKLEKWNSWEAKAPDRKLADIKEIRLQKLKETDYLANSDVTMPDNVKTWRQTLRDLPANHTDEAAYDALLARDSDGNLTHSVWSKP
jgi:hypothetical protein